MNRSRYEQETIILYNQADDEASCYTFDPGLIRKLDDLVSKTPAVSVTKEGDGFKEYSFPKKWVRVRKPPTYSEEQKRVMSERLAGYIRGKKEAQESA